MKLTNLQTSLLYNWLDIPLHGQELRDRNKVIGEIAVQYNKFSEKRQEFLTGIAEKDAEGKPILEKGLYKISEENKVMVKESLTKLSEETAEYDRKNFKGLVHILVNKLEKGMDIEEGKIFEAIITELEK